MELKLEPVWKMRLVGWLRDLILILGMWSIWLIHEYVLDRFTMIVLTWFQGVIIAIVILIKEYIVSVDVKVQELERELLIMKKRE